MDVLGLPDPEQILRLELPFVMDMVKAKIRLEENKNKAQRAAQELDKIKNQR